MALWNSFSKFQLIADMNYNHTHTQTYIYILYIYFHLFDPFLGDRNLNTVWHCLPNPSPHYGMCKMPQAILEETTYGHTALLIKNTKWIK